MRSVVVILFIILIMPDIANATTEYATFESFYKESSAIKWILSAVVALILAATIFFTGGTATPIVASIGSWVGGMMGLSGIAATKAGLALLGGGSIASGGFGVIGGTTLLSAALSFSTNVVFDYAIEEAITEYQYKNLVDYSKKMLTLPLPVNDSGSEKYKETIKLLSVINKEQPTFSSNNQKIIKNAIKLMQRTKDISNINDKSKNYALLSLLYFISNDYINAKKYSSLLIKYTKQLGIKSTLPSFIYATSSLYDENIDLSFITKHYFYYSIMQEPDNPLIPILFSIYLDRIFIRFDCCTYDDYLVYKNSLKNIFIIIKSNSIDNKKLNYTILLTRYIELIKLNQQKIISLATTNNKTIRNNSKTLLEINNSLNIYYNLINEANNIIKHLSSLGGNSTDRKNVIYFYNLLKKNYKKDGKRLEILIDNLKKYQENLIG
ncbi:interferon alpha-inducible IFI6/IFI27 family protein [Candidatus Venteria ishoeyi]|uniref:Uncharacterized protein n=1 Tax=Candidatus Venteria ishoeyi TaxID=1899563 RepID=A0A1H6F423_9GAMM|nr:interferon alpha-inducible IFI6/IFI27 family protein [Candidatus Venteria ishoeyi]SEH04928.1 Uncharacterised protein [Candidatus Venteria ishoeyi]